MWLSARLFALELDGLMHKVHDAAWTGYCVPVTSVGPPSVSSSAWIASEASHSSSWSLNEVFVAETPESLDGGA